MADFNPFGDPQTMALLGLSQGLLAAGGPHQFPVGFGGALAQGIGGGVTGATNATKMNQQQALLDLERMKAGLSGVQIAQAQHQADVQNWALGGMKGPMPALQMPNLNGFVPTGFFPAPASRQEPSTLAQPSAPAQTPPGMSPTTSQLAFGTPDYATAPPPPANGGAFTLDQLPPEARAAAQTDIAFNGGKGLAKLIEESTQKVIPQVGMVQWNPSTQSWESPKGLSDAMRAWKRAENEEAARYSFERVPMQGGGDYPVSRLSLGNGTIPTSPGGASQAPAPRPFAPRTSDPWATVPRISEPRGFGPQSTEQKATAELRVKTRGELATEFGTLAQEASQRQAFNNQALELVDKADVGPGSGFLTDLKKIAVTSGWAKEADFENTPAANTALNKDLVNSALNRGRQLFGSRFTQSEVGIMLNRAAPSAEQTRAAIKFLLQTDNAQLGYQIKQANDLGRYESAGGDPLQFKQWYAKTFPMTDAISKVDLNSLVGKSGPQPLTSAEQEELARLRMRFNRRKQ